MRKPTAAGRRGARRLERAARPQARARGVARHGAARCRADARRGRAPRRGGLLTGDVGIASALSASICPLRRWNSRPDTQSTRPLGAGRMESGWRSEMRGGETGGKERVGAARYAVHQAAAKGGCMGRERMGGDERRAQAGGAGAGRRGRSAARAGRREVRRGARRAARSPRAARPLAGLPLSAALQPFPPKAHTIESCRWTKSPGASNVR